MHIEWYCYQFICIYIAIINNYMGPLTIKIWTIILHRYYIKICSKLLPHAWFKLIKGERKFEITQCKSGLNFLAVLNEQPSANDTF